MLFGLSGLDSFLFGPKIHVQEETTFLGVPCLTVCENTERPITVTGGTNLLVGRDISRLQAETRRILAVEKEVPYCHTLVGWTCGGACCGCDLASYITRFRVEQRFSAVISALFLARASAEVTAFVQSLGLPDEFHLFSRK
jgi:hypothetical protein